MEKIGFIGMGNMARAMALGFIKSGGVKPENLYAYAPNQEKLQKNAEKIGFNAQANLVQMVKLCDALILACKPYQIEKVLSEIGEFLAEKTLISVALGWGYSAFSKILGEKARIQCVMPNAPAMIGEGVTIFEEENSLFDGELCELKKLFSCLGTVETLSCELMGIGGAISGCGPAFIDMIMESYADAAVKYGISRETAYRLVSQTMLGSAKLLQVTGKHPGVLKDEVCSPRGSTIRGVDSLEKSGLRGALISSIDAIMDAKK